MYKHHHSSDKKRFDYTVIATLRAILDAKYAEIVYNGSDFEKNTDFITYTHWWLSTYKLDEKDRKVKKITSNEENEDKNQVLW